MRTFDLYSPVVFELKPKLPHFQIDSVHWDNKVVRHCPINNFPCLQHFFAALYQQHNGSVRQNSRAILWMMPSKKYLAEKKRGKMAPDGTKKWQQKKCHQKNATGKWHQRAEKRHKKWHQKNATEKWHQMAQKGHRRWHRKMPPNGTVLKLHQKEKRIAAIAPNSELTDESQWCKNWCIDKRILSLTNINTKNWVHWQKCSFFNKYIQILLSK